MAVPSKPNRAVFLAMEDLGLAGWLPGSGRRLAVRSREGSGDPSMQREVAMRSAMAPAAMRSSAAAMPVSRAQENARTMTWLVVTAIGAVTAVALASLFGPRRR